MDVTKPFTCKCFGDMHGTTFYEFTGFRWAFISQKPVALALRLKSDQHLSRKLSAGPDVHGATRRFGAHHSPENQQ